MYRKKFQKGIALIAVLWVTAFLTIIASTIAHQSRSSLKMTKNRVDMLKVSQAAEGALLLKIAEIINVPGELNEVEAGRSAFIEIDNVQVSVSLYDESGKIDINTSPTIILQSLLLEIGLDEQRSDALANLIVDWRDEDGRTRSGDREDAIYLAAGLPYTNKNDDFQRIEELNLIYGITPEIYAALAPFVTVHTQDFGVNLTVASELVRRAVNNASQLEQETVDTDDDEFFSEIDTFTSLTSGYIFSVYAVASNEQGISKQYSAIVRIDRGNTFEPFTILKWTQS